MSSSHPPFELSIDGFAPGHFRVHTFTGVERMSEAWRFDVTVTAPVGDDVELAALGQRATLVLNLAEKQRAFYGIVASVRLSQVHTADNRIKYTVRLMPRLWLLRRKKRSRIFQRMRVPDIVSTVLLEAGITTRWQLTRLYPEREYCTQYEETDYQFVRRILAEAGIWFYFFSGGPVSGAALAADAAIDAAASAGGAVASFMGGTGVGGVVGAAAQMAETLVPGDTVIGADDAVTYPPVAGDDPAALAAATAAAMAPAIGDALGAGGGVAGMAVGAASAIAGTVIADVTETARGAPALYFMSNQGANVTNYDKVTRFTLRNQVRSSAAVFRSYDPNRPMTQLQSAAVSTQPFPPSPFEIAAQAAAAAENAASVAAGVVPGPAAGALGAVGGAIATADAVANQVGAALGQKVPFEVYEHHDPYLFPKWAFAVEQAPRILRQKRRRASIAEGESGCFDFSPGHRFELHDHPAPQLDAAYALTSVQHYGELHPTEQSEWKVYKNTFECAPASMPYPPPAPKRASVQVLLTAMVVGPAGEEIHVDEKGQIKVQFHWDRGASGSCWIRVMQPWAGAAWGHQFIPRVGMEVVVMFEGGDPDKPFVIGSVPNGTHPTPFALPRNKTQSGIRTQSSPGGAGHNELMFEDAAARERIYLHAQRDLQEEVNHDHSLVVKNDETIHVESNRQDTVGKNAAYEVLGDRSDTVRGDASVHHFGSRVDVVEKNLDQRATGMRTTRVEGRDELDVRSTAEHRYASDFTTRVTGNHTVIVGKHEAPRSMTIRVEGTGTFSTEDTLELVSNKGITLRCGKSSVRIGADGIELQGDLVRTAGKKGGMVASDEGLAFTSANVLAKLGDTLLIKTDQSSFAMGTEVHFDGQQILLNSPDKAKEKPPPDPKPPTEIELKDTDGAPLAGQRFVIELDDGSQRTGVTDKDGKVKLDLPSGGKVRFPELTEVKRA